MHAGRPVRPLPRRRHRGLPEAAELALGERPEDDHVPRVPGAHRRVGDLHRGGHAVAAPGPRNARPAQRLHAESACEAQGRVALVGERHESVDLGEREPRILDGTPDRDARELELGVRRLAPLVVGRLADAGDAALPWHRPLLVPDVLVRSYSLAELILPNRCETLSFRMFIGATVGEV
jgi:hypothetical protein